MTEFTRKDVKQPVQAVIFDCDGVLVDSEILASQVSLRMLAPYGFKMSPQEYARAFAGKVEQDTLRIIREEYGIALPEEFLPKVRLEIEKALDHDLQPIAGVREVIAKLPVTTAVVSNSRLARVLSSLKVAGLTDLFGKRIYSSEMVENPKPAPDLYELAARELGVDPAHCLVVEDSQSGVMAAHRAGMSVIGFLGASHIPPGHDQTVRQEGAFATADSMEDLGRLLKECIQGAERE